jgi:NAD-dependent SIR2 family protein deacetylase
VLPALAAFLSESRRLFVITGAGISAGSGIGTYRDHSGRWQRSTPIQHQDFLHQTVSRRRYWARSMRGWPSFRDARPNPAHEALVRLEQDGRIQKVVTQNVDGLHQRAGQTRLIELHGNLSEVVCLDCGARQSRQSLQDWLESHNGRWLEGVVHAQPDGDAEFINVRQFDDFREPSCHCGGLLKPDVVFYGDSVPRARVDAVRTDLSRSDGVLVVGSSLMVYSSFRFAKEARKLGLPMMAINQGTTRADGWFDGKWAADSASALPALVEVVCGSAN